MRRFLKRHEYKHDLFAHDLAELLPPLERTCPEIRRPHPSTFTLYFYEPEQGPPEVDTGFRLRTYSDVAVDSPTLAALLAQDWHVESKVDGDKSELGELHRLERLPAEGEELRVEVLGRTHSCNLVKAVHRRHFSAGSLTGDETHRVTLDESRRVYKCLGDELRYLGDLGPRVEVKLPEAEREEEVHAVDRIRRAGSFVPFGAFQPYMQFLMGERIPRETYGDFPEIEVKYLARTDDTHVLFADLVDWIRDVALPRHGWSFLLPVPHVFARLRRYHVCKGPDADVQYTVVETRAGRCSLKTKVSPRADGAALVRHTEASHTTDLDGATVPPAEYMRRNGLEPIDSFRKTQLKVPVVIPNGHVYQLSLDECVDPAGRLLLQLELEHAGSVAAEAGSVDEVLAEIQEVARHVRESSVGAALTPSHLTKYDFFAG